MVPSASWLAVAGSLLLFAGTFAYRTDAGLDLGFHLATGRLILDTGAIPHVDPFTYTVPDHPYLTMHSLFQVLVATVDRLGGHAALSALRVVLVLTVVAVVLRTAARRGLRAPLALAVGFGLFIASWEIRLFLRPELLSCLGLALVVDRLECFRQRPVLATLLPLLPLQLLWTWGHALSPFGPATVALAALASARDPVARGPLALVTVLMTGVLFLNPYGVEGVRFLLGLATRLDSDNVFARSIAELQSPFSGEDPILRPLLAYRVELLLAAGAMLFGGQEIGVADRLRLLVFGALSVQAMRNLSLFGVVAAIPVGLFVQRCFDAAGVRVRARLGQGRPSIVPIPEHVLAGIAVAALLVGALSVRTNAWYLADRRSDAFGSGPSMGALPTGTLSWIEEHPVPGRIWNHLNFGGALIERFWPERKVYIDGRLEVMGEAFWIEASLAAEGPGWEALLSRWDPDLALVPGSFPKILRRLGADPAWQLVEVDGAAALFLRVRPRTMQLVDEARARWLALGHVDGRLRPRTASQDRVPPWREARFDWGGFGRANCFYFLGMYPQARAEFEAALQRSDRDWFPLVQNLAATHFHLGRREEAILWYRKVLAGQPDHAIAIERLGRMGAL